MGTRPLASLRQFRFTEPTLRQDYAQRTPIRSPGAMETLKQFVIHVGWLLIAFALAQPAFAENRPEESGSNANYSRPYKLRGQPVFIPLPPGAVSPDGWLRDWCLTARQGYTGHLDEYDPAFRQAWAADYKPTGEQLRFWDKGAWPCEGGGYPFNSGRARQITE